MCDRRMAVNIQLICILNETFLALEQKCKGCLRVFGKKYVIIYPIMRGKIKGTKNICIVGYRLTYDIKCTLCQGHFCKTEQKNILDIKWVLFIPH